MRHLCKLFYVVCILFFSSCEETYNDKLFWPGEISQEYGSYITPYTLDLTYSGEKLTGKTVSFKTEDSETGTLTLNGIIPGETTTPISRIQLYENEEKGCYTFSGKNITMGGVTIEYEGSVTPKAMKLNLNVVMNGAQELAKSYIYGESKGPLEGENEFQYMLFQGACYFRISPQEGINAMMETPMLSLVSNFGCNMLQIAIPQLIKNIQLEKDGNIIAQFSSDPINLEELLGMAFSTLDETVIYKVTKNRNYQTVPYGIAQWNKVNDKFLLKLNIPALLNELLKNSGENIDSGLINGVAEAILKSEPLRLKSLLGTLNAILNNDILGYLVKADDTSFTALFSAIQKGIPMHITHTEDGHTYLFLDYQTLTPIINIIANSGLSFDFAGMMTIDLASIAKEWKLMQTVNLGLDLVPSQKKN